MNPSVAQAPHSGGFDKVFRDANGFS